MKTEAESRWSVDHDWIDALEGRCYVCGAYDVPAHDKISESTLCKKHWHEYPLGDTDWWELIKLTTEAVDKVE